MSEPLLTLNNLSCERDSRTLFSGVHYSCPPGTLLQIVGFNGAGKTTLLHTVAGLLPAACGDVRWRGRPIAQQRQAFYQDLLYLGHQVPVKPQLSVRENLLWLGALNTPATEAAIAAALVEVDLAGFEDSPCYALSAGQKRRVLLAQLYLSRAALWILDEPFTAIDKSGVLKLEAAMARHATNGGVVLFTSHQPLAMAEFTTLDLSAFQLSEQPSEEAI
ncbi:cytochrome c biogenesis heme-transporting ATPase CcmA [Gilvimarinus polysaccharolyticus]|uniref:cytochrome c biogenesis heme-transporting ATPase CcmA n=1 Tax=Gilvimarinus polysaccharolyticus TaxID=863921 RepID=UPI0006732BE0|nr:cytochrome c biogenesis heme-transporting ATPase CcmA [Gilvimarinus polysaccharolyticus]